MATPDSPGAARAAITRWRDLARDERRGAGPHVLIAASFTAQPLAPGLGVALADAGGTVPRLSFADYNQLFQVCLRPDDSGAADADEVVVVWRIEDVFERDFHAWARGAPGAGDRLLDGVRALAEAVAGLARRVGSMIVSDAPVPIGYGLDHDDPELVARLVTLQQTVNRVFDEGFGEARADRLRLAALQLAAGTRASFDRRDWLMYRQPFPAWFAHRVGAAIAEVIGARTRVPPKVVVLDCDDTLWGGISVDDGIGGLQCGDAFPGFAYRSFQIALQRLRDQGVVLALASKNDPETVRRAFAEVDGMVLTDDDIAARRISWDPKPPAVAEIAAELNVATDSVVFVDDSPYEVGAMTTQLPEVRSVRVPEQVEELPDVLAETGWFRMLRVTDDDRRRTERMIAESGRTAAATAMTHDEFLTSLDLHVRLFEVGRTELGRVTQLVNKTNQFNVTTVRRSEGDVAALVDDPDAAVHAVAVHDRFGEYGLVGVVISRFDEGRWTLDTVLMSCRVLGRGVETAMLAGVVDALRADRPGPVAARFVDSGRNALVAGLFPDHGFERVAARAGEVDYLLPADRSIAVPGHIVLDAP